ncbi:VOC family protein [Chryseolinea lacunae]|uniref:VOC family protein n=1 Tax=Chryseolinea lacunae TaxID=2801331 RepID=A0ABS1KJH7_9BACT|nr:VOC family protein [Chryseolinea lacunae]MBL0739601.1 VOC family protein [Chryseolinea lacunae]
MKRIVLIIGLLVGLASLLVTFSARSQSNPIAMKLNAGIVTPKLEASKTFYTRVLNFGVTFENEFYLLLHTPGHTAEISFLLPDHASQQPLFQPAFAGAGVYLTIEVEQVDKEYARIKSLGVPIAIALRDEPWGDRHFAITDPNGVNIDIVTYHRP